MFAQDADDQRIDVVDVKMNLVETKLELLDSRIRLWEEKPALMEMKLRDIENSITQLSFSPEQFNEKFHLLDSLLVKQKSLMDEQRESTATLLKMVNHSQSGSEPTFVAESNLIPPYKNVISI